ncbi:MAG TPA: hypothetical protein VN458_11950 [Solirubrobacterales bacterium]|nr:hypothetical protein [Solirubrobacterales bacterium]
MVEQNRDRVFGVGRFADSARSSRELLEKNALHGQSQPTLDRKFPDELCVRHELQAIPSPVRPSSRLLELVQPSPRPSPSESSASTVQ